MTWPYWVILRVINTLQAGRLQSADSVSFPRVPVSKWQGQSLEQDFSNPSHFHSATHISNISLIDEYVVCVHVNNNNDNKYYLEIRSVKKAVFSFG